jgi:hypothetical protein
VATVPTIEELRQFRSPDELLAMVEPSALGIPDSEFFNKTAQGLNQKLREAWVAARLGVAISHVMGDVSVSITEEEQADAIFRDHLDLRIPFQIVSANRPHRKPGEEYRNGQRPLHRLSDYSGRAWPAQWISDVVRAKAGKARANGILINHLVVYINFGGAPGAVDQLRQIVAHATDAFLSIWLLSGTEFVVLHGNSYFGIVDVEWRCHARWLSDDIGLAVNWDVTCDESGRYHDPSRRRGG